MTLNQYTFQSPSSQQIQVGRLDPSSLKEEEVKKTDTKAEVNKVDNANETKAQATSGRLLDIYA